jgi:5-methylcytosine-specific restriction protein A
MSYLIPEDVGPTARVLRMTQRRVLAIWERHKGICVNCGKQIDGVRDKWFCEHIIALTNGGKDNESNIGPAHWTCKKDKDAADVAQAAKSKDVKQRHLGIKDPTRRKIPSPPKAPKRPSKILPPRRPIYETAS